RRFPIETCQFSRIMANVPGRKIAMHRCAREPLPLEVSRGELEHFTAKRFPWCSKYRQLLFPFLLYISDNCVARSLFSPTALQCPQEFLMFPAECQGALFPLQRRLEKNAAISPSAEVV